MTIQKDDGFTCPRCGGGIPNDLTPGAYPGALSRWDNRTEVCSNCGQEEAMLQFATASMKGGQSSDVIHPVRGERPWVRIP